MEATIKVGDAITTDHIIPAGDRMKYRSNIPKYSEYVFEIVDNHFHRRARRIQAEGFQNAVVAGLSYGQGSSREHAALCPMFLGVRAVIARSFERIHAANLVNFGILPLVFADGKDYEGVDQGDRLEIPGVRDSLMENGSLVVENRSKGTAFRVICDLTDRQKRMILAGGALNLRNG
jgi:aconitate hydratase